MGLNIELFKKIRDRIEAIPESYNQNEWRVDNSNAPCGTAACLGGEAIICHAKTVKSGIKRLDRLAKNSGDTTNKKGVPFVAARLLGLPAPNYLLHNATARLFFAGASGWPPKFRSRFHRAKTPRGRASAAVAYLDHIIATGSLE